ncbi:acetolactate synthase large subunit [Balneolales bacterium ANBcel1]|nr:acetolactate synthase large subunit [Balneolales bacterium ANBcel1]
MTVAELFVQCLEAEGVTHIFGVPGEENESLLFALEQSAIQFVPCRHEQGAAFIANVHGRLTGRAGVCLGTLGPGATNLITGVADANLDKAPLVAITAQGGLDRLHHESHQRIDIVNMFRPITKWNASVTSPEVVTEMVSKAFRLAEQEKPGATHIELSEDVADLQVDAALKPITPKRPRRPGSDYKAIRKTVELLSEARKPLILAGNGAIRKLASKHLTEFAQKHRIPVASTFMGKGALSDRSPYSLGAIGLGFKDYVAEAFEQADLVMTVGYDVAEYPPEKWNIGEDKKIIHVDFDPAEVYTEYDPDLEVTGDISAALWELNLKEDLLPKLQERWFEPVRDRIRTDLDRYRLDQGEARTELTVPGALHIIRDVMEDDGLLISDVGTHKMWIARNFPTYCPNGCLISNGMASMGIALPGAIAASLHQPERQIVAAMGDGGFLMNAQELETARRLGTGFIVLVFNDNDYGLISWKQHLSRQRSVSTRIDNPDFPAFARSFGVEGHRAESPEQLEQLLKEHLARRSVAVIEVPISTHVNNELVDRLRKYRGE